MSTEEFVRFVHAAESLTVNLTDGVLESVRAEWGNTNVAVIKYWRDEVKLMLAVLAQATPGQD